MDPQFAYDDEDMCLACKGINRARYSIILDDGSTLDLCHSCLSGAPTWFGWVGWSNDMKEQRDQKLNPPARSREVLEGVAF